jgi:tumor protein p53-inducible protein 3
MLFIIQWESDSSYWMIRTTLKKLANMKAVQLKKFGGVDQLFIGEATLPQLKMHEVLVKVKATAVNRADTVQREGKYPPPKGASDIMGLEVAGVIQEVGKDEDKWKVGDEVMCLLPGGGYAQYATCHRGSIMRIPKGFDFVKAAAISEVFLTAYQTLFQIGRLGKGKSVLIHAGASGVGTAAIQLAKTIGCDKILTTSSGKKTDICKQWGATLAIDYNSTPEWEKTVMEHAPKGIDVILDPVGANYFHQNCHVLGEDGKIVYIAFMSGSMIEKFNLLSLFRKRGSIHFSTLRARTEDYKADLVRSFSDQFLSKYETGELKPVIDTVMKLEDIQLAHKRVETNESAGKIILTVD